MTQGNIASWKMKEGDSYSAGDVILEIETDKATMDVEAQDDGILGKILIPDGEKNVPVGTKIAIMAEEGDDMVKLEPPEDKNSKVETKRPEAQEEKKIEAPKKVDQAKPSAKSQKPVAHVQESNGLVLSPAVQSLLRLYNIDDVKQITSTGPRGRLTKGDILTHAKKIDTKAASSVAKAYTARSKLDLSNIKRAPRETPKVEAPVESKKNPVIEIQRQVNVTELFNLSQRFSKENGVVVSVNELASKAAARALLDVPAFGLSGPSDEDKLFSEIVGFSIARKDRELRPLKRQASQSETRIPDLSSIASGYVDLPPGVPGSSILILQASPKSSYRFSSSDTSIDIIDYLTDNVPKPVVHEVVASPSPTIMASLSFDAGCTDPKIASLYLDRVAQYVESPAYLLL